MDAGTAPPVTRCPGQRNQFAVWQRQMDVRKARLLVRAAVAIVAVVASGCADVSTQPNGAWTSCGNVARPSVMQVQRTVRLASPTPRMLLATERRATVVRRLYYSMCVIVGHPAHLPPNATLSCGPDFGLDYRGVFYTGTRALAVFDYSASGCSALSLSAGADQAGGLIFDKAALAAQLPLDGVQPVRVSEQAHARGYS